MVKLERLRGALSAPSREARDTLFMLALIGWTIAPHLSHLPTWVGFLAFGVLAWRARLALRQGPLPGRTGVLAIVAAAAALTFWSQSTLFGKEAGVTLLVVLMALKTLELRARRDALVVFFLGFFLVLTNFLYSQSLATAVGMGLSVWGWLTALMLAHMPVGRPPLWHAARLSGGATLIGTPIMVLLFLLFPRIGPLWTTPNGAAQTGLSDRLELGAVAELANDDSIAFRLKFEGRTPRPNDLYFRGPVLTDTDGHAWTARSRFGALAPRTRAWMPSIPQPILEGTPVAYTMTLEPTQLTWLPMLELTPATLPSNTPNAPAISAVQALDDADLRPVPDLNHQWRTQTPIGQRVRLAATAWMKHRSGVDAYVDELQRDLGLPLSAHPRTRAWARQWLIDHAPANEGPNTDALVASLYRHIASAGFVYTLAPGAYEGDAVDEFWLDRRLGFCEHFAVAFTVVLRAMGVPARVVTGYQGSDAQTTDGFIVVRQSNAHAWVEYWQPERGWVRADPTAAAAPSRVERGRAVTRPQGAFTNAIGRVSPDFLAGLHALRRLRETIDNRWNEWVLGFNRGTQYRLLREIGISRPRAEDLGRLTLAVVIGAALIASAMAWRQSHRRSSGQRFAARLARSLQPLRIHGVQAAAHESPGRVAHNLLNQFGAVAQPLAALLASLERARYGPRQSESWATRHAATGTVATWRALHSEARKLSRALTRPPAATDSHAR